MWGCTQLAICHFQKRRLPFPPFANQILMYIRPGRAKCGGVCRCTPDRVFCLRSHSLTCLALAECSHTRKSLSLNFELSHACMVNDNSTYASLFCSDFFIPSSMSYIMRWTELSGTIWRFPCYNCHAINPQYIVDNLNVYPGNKVSVEVGLGVRGDAVGWGTALQ